MAVLEIVLHDGDYLAQIGYQAWICAAVSLKHSDVAMLPWEQQTADMRNFWREWARQFTIAHMTKGA